MSRLIAAVDWRRVFLELGRTSSVSALGCAVLAGLDDDQLVDPVPVFAELLYIGVLAPERARSAVAAAAPGLTGDETAVVTTWAVNAAVATGRWLAQLNRPADPHPGRARTAQTGLRIDAELARIGLPLRALAADIARERGGLEVVAWALPVGDAPAYFNPHQSRIVLDPDQFHCRRDLVWAWCHELCHALDARYGKVSEADEEAYATLGADRLLTRPEPTTVSVARRLLGDLDAARPDVAVDDDFPAPGPASIVTFMALLRRSPVVGQSRFSGDGADLRTGSAAVRQRPVVLAGEGRPAGDTNDQEVA
jgi:hypothetical protein